MRACISNSYVSRIYSSSSPPPQQYSTHSSPPLMRFFPRTSITAKSHYRTAATTTTTRRRKIVVIVGPTGCGKSRLSIDLATRFFPSEIINSDKIQLYAGLDITTNKIPMPDRRGVPHHLLGSVTDPNHLLTPAEYRLLAGKAIAAISDHRGKLPLVVGGSNSLIHALLTNRFDPSSDVFRESGPDPVSKELQYETCFLWVDVAAPVLNEYLERRVDEMMGLGMFEELEEWFGSAEWAESTGLRQAIGVPEFEPYFRKFPSGGHAWKKDSARRAAYDVAVRAIKENTCQLAKRQAGKIQRLRAAGWDLRRLDATEAFRAVMKSGSDSGSGAWEAQVLEPSVKIVKRFLAE